LGGDPLVGSTYLDLLPLYEADPQTRALVIFGEPGGQMEEMLAEHVKARGTRLPIIAFIAGRFADRMPGVRFGHAGAIVEGRRGSPAGKIAALREAGVMVTQRLSEVPGLAQVAVEGGLQRSQGGLGCMGVFIRVEIDESRWWNPADALKNVPLCPVDIFHAEDERLRVNPDREDECILCELCLQASPPGAIRIHKLYSGEVLQLK